MISECIEVVKNADNVVIFGAGVGGAELYKLLMKNGLEWKVKAWSDNNKLKYSKTYMDDSLIIIKPDSIIEKCGENCTVIVASSAYDDIKKQLLELKIKESNIYLFNFAFMNLEYTDMEFIYEHIEQFERAFNRMSDEKSRRIFINILNYKISKSNMYLEKMTTDVDKDERQYFSEDIFDFCNTEVLLDIGAYTGDTLEAFNKQYKNGWGKYIGLEADKDMFTELKKTVSNLNLENKCEIYNLAAWNEKTTLLFDCNAGSSRIDESSQQGKMAVEADRLDNVLKNKKVSFVKMDIEGAEYNAILGMREIIQQNLPILAICVYHRREDFYNITDLIEDIVPGEYSFFMRQYRYTPTETVCYAIPKLRMI